jgi:hypothetical protein
MPRVKLGQRITTGPATLSMTMLITAGSQMQAELSSCYVKAASAGFVEVNTIAVRMCAHPGNLECQRGTQDCAADAVTRGAPMCLRLAELLVETAEGSRVQSLYWCKQPATAVPCLIVLLVLSWFWYVSVVVPLFFCSLSVSCWFLCSLPAPFSILTALPLWGPTCTLQEEGKLSTDAELSCSETQVPVNICAVSPR